MRVGTALDAEPLSSARNILILLALVAVWTLVSTSAAATSSCPDESTQAPLRSQEGIEGSLTCLINEERTSRGLRPVHPNTSLRQAALRHSNDMVSSGFFAHTTPSGVSFIDRIQATGYTRGIRSWFVGENIVWGLGPQSTPGALVTLWMNSPPHRENLLCSRFREIGIAAVRGTPQTISNPLGITVSSEYGHRSDKSGKKAQGPARHKARS